MDGVATIVEIPTFCPILGNTSVMLTSAEMTWKHRSAIVTITGRSSSGTCSYPVFAIRMKSMLGNAR